VTSLTLSVPNELAAIEPARQRLLAFVADLHLEAAPIYRLELVLEELLMNRVMHAFPDAGRHLTDVTLCIEPDELALCFEDDGIAFDPSKVPARATATSLAEIPDGGLGLVLVRKAATSCEYRRVAGRNRFTVRLGRGA
jgi:anti-sigma regulatory factor (Ser/Thr protein kinase)